MKQIIKIVLMQLSLIISQSAFAAKVQMQTGALTFVEQDNIDEFTLKREFSSRSVYRGWFGSGWCSNLDLTLDLSQTGKLSLIRCGQTQLVFEKSSDKIYRLAYRLNQMIVSERDNFYWAAPEMQGLVYVFNAKGSLYGLQLGGAWYLRLDSASPSKIKATINSDLNLVLALQIDKRVLNYTYRGQNLVSANKTQYEYDQTDNVTKIIQPNNFTTYIDYDNIFDRVKKVMLSTGEAQSFEYKLSELKQKDESHLLDVHGVSRLQDKVLWTKKQSFYYKQVMQGTLLLKRTITESTFHEKQTESLEVLYNKNGTPNFLRTSGKTFLVLYGPDRKVNELRWNNESYFFTYNRPDGKLTSIISRDINSQKIFAQVYYTYDKSGQLSNLPKNTITLGQSYFHPYELSNPQTENIFKQMVPFAPVRALATLK